MSSRNYRKDEIYIFTSERPESHVIPTEANGGLQAWDEIIRRGQFDAKRVIKMATISGKLVCWPPAVKRGAVRLRQIIAGG